MITANSQARTRAWRQLVALAATVLLAACGTTGSVPSDPEAQDTGAFPWDAYQAADGETIWRLDDEASRLWIFVGRAGPMAALGHDHVVAAGGLEGALRVGQDDWQATRGELHLPVARLAVDPAGVRDGLIPGLGPAPSAEAIAATRENLLGPGLLDAESHPRIIVHVRDLAGTPSRPLATLEIMVRGAGHALEVPVRLRREGDVLTVSGLAAIPHGDLGLEPFTALGGALRVAETLVVDFRLRFRRD
ncbi:YceI family protein [Sediminicurvatus halobius]|uniref:Lipid/polyisoprenoid-binding YceI-like domain-containing protein n=1 Tax=Sediminicurvatus halobius TaxID=2182432 RepID=A0A2U2N059_9GAMM|nr:YceI family protein [Spiribacter halobius]PWG62423.1 hypothetical protein DEM34_12430 [Spiribacter halobius]UEX79525.1 YceI family protein [Spiribacter halobius]